MKSKKEELEKYLKSSPVEKIIEEKEIGLENLEIEIEYQSETIGKYGLEFEGGRFLLTATQTDCLAKEKCGIPEAQPVNFVPVQTSSGCSSESGCC